MVVMEGEGEGGTSDDPTAAGAGDSQPPPVEPTLTATSLSDFVGGDLGLSLHSLAGVSTGRAMKLIGKMKGMEVLILIDCRATHNFVSDLVVEKLDIAVEEAQMFTVLVGDGGKKTGRGFCPSLEVEVQGLKVQQPFFPFELGGADVIL